MRFPENAIERFKELLTGFASWERFKNTQLVKLLAVFTSWILRSALWSVERTEQEFFLHTALNRSSILAHGEDRGYVPRKPQPAAGFVRVVNKGPARVTLPAGWPLLAATQLEYITGEALALAPGGAASITVSQLKAGSIALDVAEDRACPELLLDKDVSSRIHSFRVWLKEGDGEFVEWTQARLFKNTNPGSLVYDEFYDFTDRIGIRFGNGDFGRVPAQGAKVRVDYFETEGESYLAAGQPLHLIGQVKDAAGQAARLEISAEGIISGGAAAEDSEEVRKNLFYWPTFSEKLVWDEDYIFFVAKRFPDINWIRVWGEQEAERIHGLRLEHINTIFISAHAAPDREDLKGDVLALLSGVPKLNKRYAWVEPFQRPFTVKVVGKVSREVQVADVELSIRESLAAAYGPNSHGRKSEIHLHEMYRLVSATGYFPDDGKAAFSVELVGALKDNGLEDFLYLELARSEISVSYL